MAQTATDTTYGSTPPMRPETRVAASGDGKTLQQRADEAAAEAKRQAAALGDNASEAARAEAKAAADRARELAAEFQAQAQSFTDQAVDRVKSTAENAIEQQRDRASGFVGSIENAVNAAAKSLEDDGYGPIASYVRYASSALGSVHEEVDGFRPQAITGRAERAARSNPLVTYGALAIAGFALVTLMNSNKR